MHTHDLRLEAGLSQASRAGMLGAPTPSSVVSVTLQHAQPGCSVVVAAHSTYLMVWELRCTDDGSGLWVREVVCEDGDEEDGPRGGITALAVHPQV